MNINLAITFLVAGLVILWKAADLLVSGAVKLAEHFDLKTALIMTAEDDEQGIMASDWILLTKNEKFLNTGTIKTSAITPPNGYKKINLWTDDHINLFEIFR